MGRLSSILVGLLALASVSIVAAGVAPDADSLLDRPIGAISTKGLERVSEQKVLNNIRSRVGQPYDPDTARGDISRLTRLGDFSSIDIVAELRDDGSVDLMYQFTEERLLAAVSVVGNRVLSDGALIGPTGLHRGSPRDDFLIERGIREMAELYRSKGYYLAEVTMDASELEANDILIFEVVEGPRVRIRAIEFAGATKFSARKLSSEVETTTWFPFFRRGEVDQDQLASDIASLHKFYYDRGYIDIRVDKQIEVSPSQREAKVIFLIEEGSRYTVDSLTASGPGGIPLKVFSVEQLAAIMNIKVGDVFRQDLVDRSRKSIMDAYGLLGHLDSRAAIVPIRRGSTTKLSLVVEVIEGDVAKVGLVRITGNTLTKDKIIRTEVGLRPGRRFDAREIKATKERIMGTGLFGDALVTVQQPEETDSSVRDVLVEIKEKNTGSINFGVGLGSDAGVVGNISLTQNNFDLFDVPETFGEFYRGRAFRGAGQRFAVNFLPGTETFAYDINLTEPRIFGTPYALGGSAGYRRQIYTGTAGGYTEERLSVGAVLSRRLGDIWYASLRLDAGSVELTGLDPNTEPTEILNDAGPETLVSAGLVLTRTTIDRMSRPTKGSRTQLNVANWGMLGGDRDFNRISADYTTYLALDRDFLGRVSTLRIDGQVGMMFGGSAPTYEQFYLGGRSLRGFQFRTISPKGFDNAGNLTDIPIGGTFMAFLGAQYQRPLVGTFLDGVIFVDSGTVIDDPGFDDYRVAVGLGLRVYIPQLGPTPLAFDIAVPMIKQEGDATQFFSFSADLPF
jgi:outer membrane protein insertion porin family